MRMGSNRYPKHGREYTAHVNGLRDEARVTRDRFSFGGTAVLARERCRTTGARISVCTTAGRLALSIVPAFPQGIPQSFLLRSVGRRRRACQCGHELVGRDDERSALAGLVREHRIVTIMVWVASQDPSRSSPASVIGAPRR